MIIKSNYKKTPYSEIELFNICKDLNNAIKYLPSEVENINTDSDNLSFTVKGMGNIALRISNRVENNLVQMVPEGKIPFPFTLNIHIRPDGNTSECQFEIDANLNPLMQMMASRPLQNLVNMMAEKISEKKD